MGRISTAAYPRRPYRDHLVDRTAPAHTGFGKRKRRESGTVSGVGWVEGTSVGGAEGSRGVRWGAGRRRMPGRRRVEVGVGRVQGARGMDSGYG
jgi:hypothetical protein